MFIGVLVAPLAPILLMLLPQLAGNPRLNLRTWQGGATLLIIAGASYVWSYTVGLSAYLIVRRYRYVSLSSYVAAALVGGVISFPLCGALVYCIALLSGRPVRGLTEALTLNFNEASLIAGIAVGFFLAAPIAILFWLIERPDQRPVPD
jgi:hypothetical protein